MKVKGGGTENGNRRGFQTVRQMVRMFSYQCPKNFAWASKKLVTGPNGIMVAQTFCDIFFMKKRHQISIYKQFSD
jgi:hypothetical protein